MTINGSQNAMGHIAAIDGLRAVAVLSVIAFHLQGSLLPGGFLGVDIFFVISGFVVTASVSDSRVIGLIGFQKTFYGRRILRILPALMVCLVVTSVVYVLFVPKSWLSGASSLTGLAAFFGASNIVLAFADEGYFEPKAEFNPFTHTWSLGVEEQFYLLFPLLVFWLLKNPSDRRRRTVLLSVVSALCLASLVLSAVQTRLQTQHAFYMLGPRFWELGAGMLLFLCMESWRPRIARGGWMSVALSVLALGAATLAMALPSIVPAPFPLTVLAVVASVAALAVVVSDEGSVAARLLRARPVVWIGRLSYSLYLWHWPVFVLMRWTLGLSEFSHYCVALAATFGLAMLSHRWVETPFRNAVSLRQSRPWGVLLVGGVVMTTLAGCSAVAFKMKDSLTLSRTADVATWYPDGDLAVRPAGCQIRLTRSDFAGGVLKVLKPNGCGTPARTGRVIMVGDSHTSAYDRLLHGHAAETGRQVWIFDKPGCTYVGLGAIAPPDAACERFGEAVTERLSQQAGVGDVIILASLRIPRFQDQGGPAVTPQPAVLGGPSTPAADTLERLTSNGAKVVFEAPKPIFKAPPFRCSDVFNASNPDCRAGFDIGRTELEALRAPVLREMSRLAAATPGVSIWDPFPVLCPGAICSAFRGDRPLFFDGDHLSGYGNEVLLPAFTAMVDRVTQSTLRAEPS